MAIWRAGQESALRTISTPVFWSSLWVRTFLSVDLDVDGDELAALGAAAGSNGDDLALLWLLLSGVGNDDATSSLRLGIDSLDDNAVVKRSEFHRCLLKL